MEHSQLSSIPINWQGTLLSRQMLILNRLQCGGLFYQVLRLGRYIGHPMTIICPSTTNTGSQIWDMYQSAILPKYKRRHNSKCSMSRMASDTMTRRHNPMGDSFTLSACAQPLHGQHFLASPLRGLTLVLGSSPVPRTHDWFWAPLLRNHDFLADFVATTDPRLL